MRRERLYSSHLTQWRQQLREHGEAGLDTRRPGAKPKKDERDKAIEHLERKTARLEHEPLVARKLIELAGKAHEILGVGLPRVPRDALMELPVPRDPIIPPPRVRRPPAVVAINALDVTAPEPLEKLLRASDAEFMAPNLAPATTPQPVLPGAPAATAHPT